MGEEDPIQKEPPSIRQMLQKAASRMEVQQSRMRPNEVRRVKAIGAFWRRIREESGKSRVEVAEALSVGSNDIALFEHGLLPNEDLPEQFIIRLAHFLGRIDALDTHIERYETELLHQAIKKIVEEERNESKEDT